jgi:cytochrome c oxidase subunit IV
MPLHWGGAEMSTNATLNSAMAADRQTKDRLTKDLIVYGIILAIAGLQVLMAYHTAPGKQLLVQMLALALVQGGIAVAFFMHLRDEKRGLIIALIPTTIFVLVMMNMIWSDSFRLFRMHP